MTIYRATVVYRRLHAIWYAQHADRRTKLSEMQLGQVKTHAGLDQRPPYPQPDPILPCKYSQYRDSLDDLEEEESREL
jgi:hypothetical protein